MPDPSAHSESDWSFKDGGTLGMSQRSCGMKMTMKYFQLVLTSGSVWVHLHFPLSQTDYKALAKTRWRTWTFKQLQLSY